ncbi:hypothetical protein HELRODRAFT_88092 [Helobdella robusta]|uniref:C-CAP/cofactor C-like domain-containing protein n=1 Tax=Helobdella robusta TaxID=6412 RepID=T1G6Y3_HELRO|nr:hypothetical protein HELRODRAFT_88092 [Helobdella robusta]ESN93900.1 hypothetical protein HELRODRAFT_88092 [Helobdella robusta]
MGCNCCKYFSRKLNNDEDGKKIKAYSWDNRDLVEIENFMVQNIENETIIRHPGTINGQQFIIQNCKNCKVFVMDHTAAVNIDDCLNCSIFLGPIKTSLFIRDSNDCKLMAACQQFRSRDCKRIDTYLHCTTLPIIEASTNMRFSCYQCYYPELPDQFVSCNLNVFNNNWDSIHDFTPVPGEKNYSFLPFDDRFSTEIPEVGTASVITADSLLSVVPLTYGSRPKKYDESCFVVFFIEPYQRERVLTFLRYILDVSDQIC